MVFSDGLLNPAELAAARRLFHVFARVETPVLESPLYTELCYAISEDDRILQLAMQKRPEQPAPNLLFAAVQYLLLRGEPYAAHALAAHYPYISGEPRPLEAAAPAFRHFVHTYAADLLPLIQQRGTQTNVVRRCSALLPLFSMAAAQAQVPLALIDLGASGGLNLNFDRYAYRYERGGAAPILWGNPDAPVQLSCELKGAGEMPPLAASFDIASRVGIDLNPLDVQDLDQQRWLKALIWPEHLERYTLLEAAAAELAQSPVTLRKGDAAALLAEVIAETPAEHEVVVYATIALYQFGEAGRQQVQTTLQEAGRQRPITFLSMEGRPTKLFYTRYQDGNAATQALGESSPHAWWIAWTEAESA